MWRPLRSLTVAALCSVVGFAQPRQYELTELPSPGRGLNIVVWVGEDGSMIGSIVDVSAVPQTSKCYRYVDGQFQFLETPGFDCYAQDANSKGEIVGSLTLSLSFSATPTGGSPRRAFVYRDGAFLTLATSLPAPKIVLDSAAYAINERGEVIGTMTWYDPGQSVSTIESWVHSGGEMRYLPDLGGRNTRALAINELGDVAGDSHTATQEEHAVVVAHDGRLTDLGTLGGNTSSAYAINASGQTAGHSLVANGPFAKPTAFFHNGVSMLPIYVEGTTAGTASTSLNDAGEVVGMYYVADRTGLDVPRAFYYFGDKTVTLLSLVADAPVGVYLTTPKWIDNDGRVLAYGGVEGDNATHTYLLSPIEDGISQRRWRRR